MKTFQKIILILLVVLSVTEGVAKVLQVPDDVEFFQRAGLSITTLIILGAAQILGGVLLVIQKTRIFGAIIIAVTLLISSIVIFINGKLIFGMVSLLPIILVALVIKEGKIEKDS